MGGMAGKLLDRPIIVIGCNRSGTTLLFNNLGEHPETWSLYEESQEIFYRHFPIDPEAGDRLTVAPAPDVGRLITEALFAQSHNKEVVRDTPLLRLLPRKLLQRPVNRLYKRPPIRLVEKTPANSLRIPFLSALFPDAKFLFLVRRAEDVISSLMEGWKHWSGTGAGAWKYGKWHYLVPPGWQAWTAEPLPRICAFQWVESTRTAWADLEHHCPDRYLLVRHEDAIARPADVYRRILDFCELPPSRSFEGLLAAQARRVFTHGGSAPRPDKWRALHGAEIETVRPMFQDLMRQFYPEGE
jgi:hypothetical protein